MTHSIVLVITGGGTQVVPQLFARPGASNLMLEARVPYHPDSLAEFLGGKIDRAASLETSRSLAVAALQRAKNIVGAENPKKLAGVACTAALATNRPRRGNDRAHITVHSDERTISETIDFGNGRSDRAQQESVTALEIVRQMLKFGISFPEGWEDIGQVLSAYKIDDKASSQFQAVVHSTESEIFFERHEQDFLAPPVWQDLAKGAVLAAAPTIFSYPSDNLGHRSKFSFDPSSIDWVAHNSPIATNAIIFPGSFNPPHAGHREMAAYASQYLGKPVIFELAITNAEKPMLDFLSIRERLGWLDSLGQAYVITRTPRFYEKAELFPGSVFIIGADTAVRIADPKFYNNDSNLRDNALKLLADNGCQFLLFGRVSSNRFLAANGLELPDLMRKITTPVPEIAFRNDISSTELRRNRFQ